MNYNRLPKKIREKIEYLFNGDKESLNGILKSGEKVKFKFESDLETIFIQNGDETEYLEKNEEGLFEKEIIIRAQSGGHVTIGKSNGFILSSYYIYKVV